MLVRHWVIGSQPSFISLRLWHSTETSYQNTVINYDRLENNENLLNSLPFPASQIKIIHLSG